MNMMGKWWLIAKTLVKSSVDHYVLPGTATGTEILLVYLYQWKRNISFAVVASLYQLLSQRGRNDMDEALVHAREPGSRDAEEGAA